MAATISIGNTQVPLLLRKGKPHSLRLQVVPEGVLLETGTGDITPAAQDFLLRKQRWLHRTYPLMQQGLQLKQLYSLNPNLTQVFGKQVPVVYLIGAKLRFKYTHQQLTITYTRRHVGQEKACLRAVHRQLARHYLTRRLQELAHYCQLSLNEIRIKEHRSKWGSCSIRRNINLNVGLVMVAKEVIDYVLIHELMHLHEMNHGPKFWAHVARYLPNYAQLRKQLQAQEWLIGLYSA